MSLLPFVAIFLIFWLLVIRPASRKQKALQQVQRTLEVGDEIVTNSGFFGTVRGLDDDRLSLELAEGVTVQIARAAVAGVTSQSDDPALPAESDYEQPSDPTADEQGR